MPKIGVSKPYVADYEYTDGAVKYSNGQILAKAAELSTTMNSSSDNNFYADNGISEADTEFSNGSGTLTVDDLLADAAKVIYGLTQTQHGDGEMGQVPINHYDNKMTQPYKGFGIIIMIKNNNAVQYRGVIFKKVQFTLPSEAVQTRGATINWQTTPLPFTILRDDSENQEWMQDGLFKTEDEALQWIKTILIPATQDA